MMKLWHPTRCASCRPLPENTIETQRLRASLIRESDSRAADMIRSASCATTRLLDKPDDAYTFAAHGTVVLLSAGISNMISVEMWVSSQRRGAVVQFEDWGLDAEARAEMACLLSAVLASGRIAACDMCAAPAKAVDYVRAVLRRHAIGVAHVEGFLRQSPDKAEKFKADVLCMDPEVIA